VYKSTTVEEKLDTIPIFDINDNGNVDNSGNDVLTYGHIIDNLNSSAVDKTLSANQGKVLKELIDDVDSEVNTLNSTLSSDINTVSDRIESTHSEIENLRNDLINIIYPIGSIYMSVNDTNPSLVFGGTWQQIKDRFLLASGDTYDNGQTGGSATHTPSGTIGGHALTVEETAIHYHNISSMKAININDGTGTSKGVWCWDDVSASKRSENAYDGASPSQQTATGEAHNHSFTGTNQNTMPPYLAVNVWVRTA
jgi:hypothetical protein